MHNKITLKRQRNIGKKLKKLKVIINNKVQNFGDI